MKSQSKEVVYTVHTYFEKLHSKETKKRTIEATGIVENTVRAVLKEKEETGKFESPSKHYRSSRKSFVVGYDEECIRKVVYGTVEYCQ